MANRIYIIGAGAIGKALTVCLANAGKDAVLVRSSRDHQPDVLESVWLNLSDGAQLQADLEVKTFSAIHEPDGIFVVTGKSFANDGISEMLLKIAVNGPVVL